MLGAIQTLLGSVGARTGIADQARYDAALVTTHERLDRAQWDTAWQQGRAMNITQATSLAMSTEYRVSSN
jgi:hypothetical protein